MRTHAFNIKYSYKLILSIRTYTHIYIHYVYIYKYYACILVCIMCRKQDESLLRDVRIYVNTHLDYGPLVIPLTLHRPSEQDAKLRQKFDRLYKKLMSIQHLAIPPGAPLNPLDPSHMPTQALPEWSGEPPSD
jgi:hypothetical protein